MFHRTMRGLGAAVAGLALATTGLSQVATAAPTPTKSPSATPTAAPTSTKSGTQKADTPTASSPTAKSTKTQRAAGQLTEDFTGPAGAAPNPDTWGYDTGRGFEGWGNWEKEFYTNSRHNSWLDGDGHLVIQAKYEPQGGTMEYGDDWGNSSNWQTQWTSARLNSHGKFNFKYGHAEARMKVAQGAGMWPAFWGLGSDNPEHPWPESGETDIFEGGSWARNSSLSNVFGGKAWNDKRSIAKWTDWGKPIGQDFHTYGLDWTPDTLQFLVDGKLHHEVTRASMGADWRMDKPMDLILNLAVGGNFGGAFDEHSAENATTLVDYVHVTSEQTPKDTPALQMSKKWAQSGALTGPLGDSPRGDSMPYCGLRDNGCVQRFERGLVYWSNGNGAHPVWGRIGDKYAELKWETGFLGYPVSDEKCNIAGGGCVQHFQGGSIYWSIDGGYQIVRGAIAEKFAQLGQENSGLGRPTGDEFCGLRDNGCGQAFTHGMMYWSPRTGAHPVWGEISRKYADLRWENSPLGYPTSDEFCGLRDGGCAQRFSGGLIYWSPRTGAHGIWGAIGTKYAQLGWENSPLGYPTGEEFCGLRDRGCGQAFSNGMIYWSGASGAHPVWGAIGGLYAAQGWENGRLRYPVTDEMVTATGWQQNFQGGVLTWRR